jgi:ribosomal protein S6--L-glutamate ligase
MRLGVITAWVEEDATSRRLLDACAREGEAVAIDPASLSARAGPDGVAVLHDGRSLAGFDAFLLVRGIGASGDGDVQFDLYRALEVAGAPVLNRLEAMLAAQDKLRTSLSLARAAVPTPAAAAAQEEGDALRALATLQVAVAKPLYGSLGDGVELLRDDAAGRARCRALLAQRGALYLQAFVEHGGRDVRAFVVGDRVEAAIERRAPPGEFRTNVSVGGEPRAFRLPDDGAAVAVAAARTLGLDWAGVDLAFGPEGPTVLEVNGSPNFEGIFQATGLDMAVPIVRHAMRRARARRRWPEVADAEPVGRIGG